MKKRFNIRKDNHGLRGRRPGFRRGFLAAAAVLLLLILACGPASTVFFGNRTNAQAEEALSEVQYKIIEIKKGDSLWSIARDNMNPGYKDIYNYIQDIKECNQLDQESITAGNYLMIPYYEPARTGYAESR